MSFLIVNHDKGMWNIPIAKRIWKILPPYPNHSYVECKNREDYLNSIKSVNPEYVIINWHKDRINWLLESDITPDRKFYFLFHDGSIFSKYDKYLFFGEYPNYPTSIPREKSDSKTHPKYDGIIHIMKSQHRKFNCTDHKRFQN
jgi:hypothetical protein